MYKKYLSVAALLFTIVISTFSLTPASRSNEVNIYSARKESLIKPLLDQFSAETGIKTNLITASADELLTRMVNEGRNTPADILITVDAGRLVRARQADIFQPIKSQLIDQAVPSNLRDTENYWVGLSRRARVIFYARERVDPAQLSTYENLADRQWRGRICIRGSGNIYNQSLVASMIAANGEQATQQWVNGLVGNMARPPKGGDRDQIRAAAAGQCDIAIANTYYYARMLNDKNDSAQSGAANKMAIFWPNQQGRGAHINISGAGISKYSRNLDNAIKLLEFLISPVAQSWYANANYEYPVNPSVKPGGLVSTWGAFKADVIDLSRLGELNSEAVKTMDRAGWK
jgi:iron(III) transport system substrate-binding protein